MNFLHVNSLFHASVLILGCGRSVTSLLLSILSAHPEIHCIGTETFIFDQPRKFGIPYLDHLHHMHKMVPFIRKYPPPAGMRYICEKTPSNVGYLHAIIREFNRNLRVIHLVRDGRDVVTSRHPENPDEYWISPHRWVSDVSMGLAYDDHDQVLRVHYEALVQDGQQVLLEVMGFLGLEYDQRLDDFSLHTKVREMSAWFNPVQPVYSNSVQRWKEEKHQGRVQEFNKTAGALELLTRLGYH